MLANKFINFGNLLFSVLLIAAILKKKKMKKIMKGRAVYWEITGSYQFLIYDCFIPFYNVSTNSAHNGDARTG